MDYCMNVPGFVDSLLILGGKPIQHINWGHPSGLDFHEFPIYPLVNIQKMIEHGPFP